MNFYILLSSLILTGVLLIVSNKWLGLSLKYWYNPLVFINIFHLLIHTLMGAAWIVFGLADNSVVHKISYSTTTTWTWYILLSIVIYTFIVTQINRKSGKDRWKMWYNKECRIDQKDSLFYGFLILVLIFCGGASVYVTLVSGFSFFRLSDAIRFRFEVSRNFAGIIYIKTIFFDFLPPFLSVIFYSFYLQKRKLLTLSMFLISFLLAFYSTTYSFAKSPFFVFVLTLLIVRISYRGVTRGVKYFFVISISILVSFFVLLSQAGSDIQFVAKQIVERIIVDEVAGSYLMYEIFPDKFDFIGFGSLTSLVELARIEHSEPATRIAMEYAFGDRALKSMNLLSTYYLGEAWANFGIVGVFISPLYVSVLIGFATIYLRDLEKSPLTVALMSYMVIPSSISSQFNNFIFNPTLISVGLMIFLLRSVKSKFT